MRENDTGLDSTSWHAINQGQIVDGVEVLRAEGSWLPVKYNFKSETLSDMTKPVNTAPAPTKASCLLIRLRGITFVSCLPSSPFRLTAT